MTALTKGRDTPVRDGRDFVYPVKATVIIFPGALVMLDADGWAVPATEAATLKKGGRSREEVTGGATDGAEEVRVDRGVFRYANAGDVTRAHIGDPAYAVDDQTVSADDNSAARSPAGTIVDLDAHGVWIEI